MSVLGMIAGQAAQTGLGLGLQAINDRRQLRQEKKLLEQQAEVDRKQAAFTQALGIQTWKQTGPQALTEELKAAGLSPALQYGGGAAGGGTTGASSSGVNASSAPSGGGEIVGLAMAKAQIELMKAQTEKTQVEAAKTAGVDTLATSIQTELGRIEMNMKTETYEATKAAIEAAAKKAGAEAEVADKTKGNKIDIVEGELIGLTLANELKRAQTGVAEETIKKIIAEVKQGWKALDIQAKNAAANMISSEAAKQNANTNVREFLEHVRKNDYDYEIRRGALELEKWLKDVPESQKLTVGALQNVLINTMPKRK